MGLYSHQEAETGLLTGPSGLQPVRKAHGLHVDKNVEIWITKVESALGGCDERVETELLTHVL